VREPKEIFALDVSAAGPASSSPVMGE